MKKLLLTLLLSGCAQQITLPKPIVESKLVLAWGEAHQDWTSHLVNEIKNSGIKSTVKTPCPNLDLNTCFAQLVSIMAKYESAFKTESQYKESFKDSKGNYVVSRGLLQISIESANQSAYKCNIKDATELHNPLVNLSCAVKIITYQANKSGYLMAEPKLGCASYFSVCRNSSSANKKIKSYLSGLK